MHSGRPWAREEAEERKRTGDGMDKPLVSVVMPAYNCIRYISWAVESVLEQSYSNWELIIVDDCSQDGSRKKIEAFSTLDRRIRCFRNERNLGVGRSRNRGIELAKGEWIAFLDSDDVWTADKLEKQMALLSREPQARLLFTGSAFITESGEPLDYVLHVPERIDRRRLLRQNLLSCSSILAKRDLMLSHPFPDRADMHEDFAVWLRILSEEDFAYGLDEPLLIYRLSPQSRSGNKLKAAVMNWNTYRAAGLSLPGSLYNMCWYALNGIRKYRKL